MTVINVFYLSERATVYIFIELLLLNFHGHVHQCLYIYFDCILIGEGWTDSFYVSDVSDYIGVLESFKVKHYGCSSAFIDY